MLGIEIFFMALFMGVISTLPLGPSGLSIVSAFGLKGAKAGLKALMGLVLAELIYMSIALYLKALGILTLSKSVETTFTLIFAFFLMYFGFKTYKSSKEKSPRMFIKFQNVFAISMANPTLLLFYLGLLLTLDKNYPLFSMGQTLGLASIFLLGVLITLISLGALAMKEGRHLKNRLGQIKAIIGPVFMVIGLTSAISSF
ncbi:LysE family transporter [Halobacteriovorax sp. GB3]|uniref:LysE family transporter n=1 Tax=Halobacteriovorax sp. GB3 TaxID=2719615 RepID=UPI00235E8F69|nr:LysE family transporter [Halobacteriovorax sp. GB3]MDD0851594.1 LysE family transporter [Halobacteriovorax sp. GB3]